MPLRKNEVVSLYLKILVAILLVAVGTSATNSSIQEDDEFSFPQGIPRGRPAYINIERNVVFELYTRQNPQTPERMDVFSMTQNTTRPKYFDPQKPVRICVHGWLSSPQKMMNVGRAFLSEGDYNLIMVNWVRINNVVYPIARKRVEPLGKWLAHFLDVLVDIYHLNVADFHLVGFSLGAHIAGVAGRNIQKGRIGRITGLDPAGPLFKGAPDSLSYDAASFVDVIHTCGKIFGHWKPVGHVDFYPNGGNSQPGCLFSPRPSCSHNRAREFFVESITSQIGFWSWPYAEGPQGSFPTNRNKARMGYSVDTSVRGVYYLVTSRRPPYAVCPPFNTPECTGTSGVNNKFADMPDLLLDERIKLPLL